MFPFFYNIGINILLFLLKGVAFFNSKFRKTITGQTHSLKVIETIAVKKAKRFWFHCASLGEFEMAIPLIEALKKKDDTNEIIVTFFSPSGYEKCKNYPVHAVLYLPPDTAKNVKKWYNCIQPDCVFFVKYDFWFNYLNEGINNRKLSYYLINGRFNSNHFIFKWYGKPWNQLLKKFSQLFVINSDSNETLVMQGFSNVKNTGDTRFDRVWEICQNNNTFPEIELFKEDKSVLILGSSWEPEEQLLKAFLLKSTSILAQFKIIIAPHNISENHISEIAETFKDYKVEKYSSGKFEGAQILIIDNIGMLSRLYRYADIALIGGGFGKGLHNILEACTYGMPILFGPKIYKFPEAQMAIDLGFGNKIASEEEFELKLNLLLNNAQIMAASKYAAKEFVQSRCGTTELILKSL